MGKYYRLTGSPVLVVDFRSIVNCDLVHDFSCFARLMDSLRRIYAPANARNFAQATARTHSNLKTRMRISSRCAWQVRATGEAHRFPGDRLYAPCGAASVR